VHCTLLENPNGARLVKTFAASANGYSLIDGDAPWQEPGALARDIDLGPDPHREMEVFRDAVRPFRTNQCLLAAGMPAGSAAVRPVIRLPDWARLPEDQRALPGDGPLARTAACFHYVPGRPALIGLDLDVKGMPAPQRRALGAAGGPLKVLQAINPQLQTAGLCVRLSASARLMDRRTNWRRRGAMHVFLVAEDASAIERWLNIVSRHFVRRGFGWARIDKTGEMHLRTPLDVAASGKAERLWFEGAPIVFDAGHGLHLEPVQNQDPTVALDWAQPGARVDLTGLPDLTAAEQVEAEAIEGTLLAASQAEAHHVREAYAAARVARSVAAGLSRAEAQAQAMLAIKGGRLELDVSNKFDDGTWRTGWEILANVAAIVGKKTGADPLEPDYHGGRNIAVWFTRPGEPGVFCFSQAHHHQEFHLAYDAPDIVALVPTLSGTIPEQLARLREAYRQYRPIDPTSAAALLAQHGLPVPSAALDFVDLSLQHLGTLFEAQDRGALASLRRVGGRRLFEAALAELREFAAAGLITDPGVDWDGLAALLDVTDQQYQQDQVRERASAAPGSTPSAAIWDPWAEPPPPAWPGGILSAQAEAALARVAARDGLDHGLLCCTMLTGVSAAAHKGMRFIPYQSAIRDAPGLWSVPPIVWVVPVGDSGFRKTRYVKVIFVAIQEVARVEWQAYHPLRQNWQSLPKNHRGPEPVAPPSRIVDDFTYEGLRDALHASGRGTALVADELVGLLEFDRYKGGRAGGANAGRGFLLSTFDDEPKNAVRAGNQIIHVEHTGCAMFGGIQRRRIAGFKGDLETDGFLQRMCPIMVPPSPGSQPGAPVPPGLNQLEAAIEALCTLDARTYTTTPAGSDCIHGTEEAAKKYAAISDYGEGWPGFCFKLHGLHARFAVLLHLLEDPNTLVIPSGRVERARRLVHGFILPHAALFHGELLGSAGDIQRDIAGWLLTRNPPAVNSDGLERVLGSDITNNVKSCRPLSSRGIGEVLDRLVTGGWLVPETPYPTNRAWLFDPALRRYFAARGKAERERRAAMREQIERIAAGRGAGAA
jgi:hypothetical protein